ncbi:MAG: hypothetical protein J1F23_08470 [Oscillospiraceae bacterium]|nr:hypothetical protein [Oscillospiraceae bacterium]
MAKTVPITEKPIPDKVSPDAYILGIQNNAEGQQALYRLPLNKINTTATKEYVDTQIESELSAFAQKSQYRLIADITLEEPVLDITVTRDMEDKKFYLKKVYLFFQGTFTDDPDSSVASTGVIFFKFNGGTIYQMYRKMTITAGTPYMLWIESERKYKGGINIYNSIYPEDFPQNAQGLSGGNKALVSDIYARESKTSENIVSISFGNYQGSTKLLEAGSRIIILGVDDDE